MTNFTNYTNFFANATTLKGLLNIPNQTTHGFAWIGLMIMIEAIMFMALLPYGFSAAIITSAFLCLIASMFLVYLNLLSWSWLMIF